jgi:hypothetical protein
VFEQIFIALGIAVGLMYLILVMQFGSFLDPMAIMLSLPLSLIGVFLALSLSRNTINIMSLIGVILLMGIVAKNAILLIDFAKWAREGRHALREALIEASAIHLRPIRDTFADRGHGANGAGQRGGLAVPVTPGRGGHRGGDHVDAAHAARDPDVLRDPRRAAHVVLSQAGLQRGPEDGRAPRPGAGGASGRLKCNRVIGGRVTSDQ